MFSLTWAVTISIFIVYLSSIFSVTGDTNNRPIVGILAQEVSPFMKYKLGKNYTSYIAASYVKFVEGAGARVVPIKIGKDEAYYQNILSKINGVLWPGGASSFDGDGYARAGTIIYKIAKKMNKNSDYFPIFGICLGFELMTYVAANSVAHRIPCNSSPQTIPLVFSSGYDKSKMFGDIPFEIKDILETKNVTVNSHHLCITKNALKKVGIDNQFQVLSTNEDLLGKKFISSIEHVSYPFYGVQFHPEKNLYEWLIGHHIPHGKNSIKAARYFADFFISEARKNEHRFQDKQEEIDSLIYNYNPLYTGRKDLVFEQCYFFN